MRGILTNKILNTLAVVCTLVTLARSTLNEDESINNLLDSENDLYSFSHELREFYSATENNGYKPESLTIDDIFPIRTYKHEGFNGTFIKPPEKKRNSLIELKDDYLMMVPMNKNEDIEWVKNMYSDMNMVTICDSEDKRKGCDVTLKNSYPYEELPKKTLEMFQMLCRNQHDYKVYAKIDFDTFISKEYIYKVFKYMIDNYKKRIYFGDPMNKNDQGNGIAMNGKFYAFTSTVLADFCSCKVPVPSKGLEDMWFGTALSKCYQDKNIDASSQILYLKSKEDLIHHKEYKKKNVDFQIGRKVLQKQKK
ncbi:hypothetical protein AYI69_g2202 [Smittium culicis]|uniref:Hexosyltransferase n=1 Tax=Smittium culicis TaxID=133412 RepID=A0A1R1YN33_9FUNG|nr:hypothetical protein AYI69_g2202 [Smittium culicis]